MAVIAIARSDAVFIEVATAIRTNVVAETEAFGRANRTVVTEAPCVAVLAFGALHLKRLLIFTGTARHTRAASHCRKAKTQRTNVKKLLHVFLRFSPRRTGEVDVKGEQKNVIVKTPPQAEKKGASAQLAGLL
jgi:hypothetical protein